jgi:uncharacterized membrane protein
MLYQIDWSRLLGVSLLLGAGTVIATRFAGAAPTGGGQRAFTPMSRMALRGMWLMTLLGLTSGVAGALLDNAGGPSAVVWILHGVYGVCWGPAFWISSLQQALATADIAGRFFSDLLGLLGVLLVPVFWFGVFLGAARMIRRLRRA